MPFNSLYEDKGICFTMTGEVIGGDLFDLENELYCYEKFDSLKYVIIDYTEAVSFKMKEGEVKIAAARDSAASLTNPKLKIAVVSSDKNLVDALLLYSSYRGGHPWESSLHDTHADARQWVRSNCMS